MVSRRAAALSLALCLAERSTASGAELTAASFPSCFGGTGVTGSAPVIMIRTVADVDAGCDFGSMIPFDAAHARIEVRPDGPVNGGFWNLSLLFFDESGRALDLQPVWVTDTQSSAIRVLPDVRTWAQAHQVERASSYRLRFRVQPQNRAGAAFAFRNVRIGPVASSRVESGARRGERAPSVERNDSADDQEGIRIVEPQDGSIVRLGPIRVSWRPAIRGVVQYYQNGRCQPASHCSPGGGAPTQSPGSSILIPRPGRTEIKVWRPGTLTFASVWVDVRR